MGCDRPRSGIIVLVLPCVDTPCAKSAEKTVGLTAFLPGRRA